MPNNTAEPGLEKAMAFFSRAEQVAATDNFDYAIDMYIEGLRRAPDALGQGHKPLRHNALIRQGKGGKKPSMIDKMKHSRGKSPLDNMLNAEYLLAKDPDNLSFAESMLKAAVAGGYSKTALWIADLLFEASKASEKPNLQTFLLLKDSFSALEQYDKAVSACSYVVRLKPNDGALADELKNLSASMAVKKGRYEEQGDFRNSIKDREKQEKLQAQQNVVKSDDYKITAVKDARAALAKQPGLTNNIIKLADALADMHNDQAGAEAVRVLEDAYKKSSDFSIKRHQGLLKIKLLKQKLRNAKTQAEARSGESNAKALLAEAGKSLLNAELEHYRLCVENYPTDLRMKYEYGIRLMRSGKYDEAIPLLQEARNEPGHKISAMSKIGMCFFLKGWFSDAVETFKEAIDAHEFKDDSMAKELLYNLSRGYEQQGLSTDALDSYRKLAQMDFGYKDVRKRIDKLRNTNG